MLFALTFKAQDGTLVAIVYTTFNTYLLTLFQVQLVGLKVSNVLLADVGKLDKALHLVIRYGQILLLVREGRFTHVDAIVRFVADILLQSLLGATGKNQSGNGRNHRTLLLSAHGSYLIFHRYVTAESSLAQCIPHFLFVVHAQAAQHIPFRYLVVSF